MTLTWSCTDTGSGPASATVTRTLSTDGANQSSTGTCTDLAGNSAGDTQTGIEIDTTPPVVTASPSDSLGANAWHATPFTVHWDGSDPGAGIESCSSDSSVSAETASGNVQGTCTDLAGNSATATYPYKLDTEAPTIAASDITATGTNAGLVVASYSNVSASDNLGSAVVSCTPYAPHTFPAGQTTPVSCTATDNAGNQSTASFHVQVDGTSRSHRCRHELRIFQTWRHVRHVDAGRPESGLPAHERRSHRRRLASGRCDRVRDRRFRLDVHARDSDVHPQRCPGRG